MATILVVDDEYDILELLKLIVEDCGHQALTAQNGAVALTLARQHAPSLVVTDLMMPVMDGYALVAALQADPILRATPIVVVTAGILAPERHAALGAVHGMLAKPFDIVHLEALFDGIGEGH